MKMGKFLLSMFLLVALGGCVENKIDRQIRCPGCNTTYHICLTAGFDDATTDLYGIDKICLTRRCNCGRIILYENTDRTVDIVKAEEE